MTYLYLCNIADEFSRQWFFCPSQFENMSYISFAILKITTNSRRLRFQRSTSIIIIKYSLSFRCFKINTCNCMVHLYLSIKKTNQHKRFGSGWFLKRVDGWIGIQIVFNHMKWGIFSCNWLVDQSLAWLLSSFDTIRNNKKLFKACLVLQTHFILLSALRFPWTLMLQLYLFSISKKIGRQFWLIS